MFKMGSNNLKQLINTALSRSKKPKDKLSSSTEGKLVLLHS